MLERKPRLASLHQVGTSERAVWVEESRQSVNGMAFSWLWIPSSGHLCQPPGPTFSSVKCQCLSGENAHSSISRLLPPYRLSRLLAFLGTDCFLLKTVFNLLQLISLDVRACQKVDCRFCTQSLTLFAWPSPQRSTPDSSRPVSNATETTRKLE